jgi:2-polyprenyl-3-methyl-5-hydroxy-6-metoxy-1,4-benzoquinol methylase
VKCAVCQSGPAKRKLRKGNVDILECPDCGLAFWVPPNDFRAEDVYDAAYFDGEDASHGFSDYAAMENSFRATFSSRISRLDRPGAGGRLLDVGAAYGFAVSEAEKLGWSAVGLEVSVAASRKAADETGGKVAVGNSLATPFASESFDVITMWDVLEHLSDPHQAIAELARLLKPGGQLVFTTTDVGSLIARLQGSAWHLYTLPEHLYFFTRKSLDLLVRAHGLDVEDMRTEWSYFTLGYLWERIRKTLLGHVGASGSWPGSRIRVPVNLFDIVTVAARKPTAARDVA